jgi:hypothetical protein
LDIEKIFYGSNEDAFVLDTKVALAEAYQKS